MYYKS
jgi:WD40 repeat protein